MLDLAPPAIVTDPINLTPTFGYDTKGNLTTITNALNKTTTFTVHGQGLGVPVVGPCIVHQETPK